MIEFKNNCFILSNDYMSYVMSILKNGHLAHVYYGPKVTGDFQYLFNDYDKQAGTVKFDRDDHRFSLADQMLEYPVYGSTDFKQGALHLKENDETLYLDLKYDHYTIVDEDFQDFMPHAYGNNGETLIIYLIDHCNDVQVKLFYTFYNDSPVIVRKAEIMNMSEAPRHLTRAMSYVLNLRDDHYKVIYFSGNWARERNRQKQDLSQGGIYVESLYGSSSHQQNPFIALIGEKAYSANLIYSGNFINQCDVNEWGMTRVMGGIHPYTFDYLLESQQAFTTPEAILGFGEDLDDLSRVNSAFINHHIIHQKTAPIVLNSWESFYYEYDEEKLLKLAQEAKDSGIECFVLDDGWFGHRDNDRTSLGDWYADQKKFPHGLGHFAKAIHALDLQFGLWIEPEMVSEDSDLYRKHPEYVVGKSHIHRSYGRSQLVLDFANPQVVENIWLQLQKIIDETHPDYLKWDMNRDITEAYSPYLASIKHPQGEFFHRYILGVYHLYQKILNYASNIFIEGCAGGGGRFDLGILYYSPMIWVSDDTDAIERLRIQNNTSYAYPLSCLSNHISDVPNHQTHRITPMSTRYHTAIFGQLGYELQLNISIETVVREQINTYKKMRNTILTGDFYHLPHDNNEIIWAVTDDQNIYLGYFLILNHLKTNPQATIRLPFVNVYDCYRDMDNQYTYTGSQLKYIGIKKPRILNAANKEYCELATDFSSKLIHLKKIKK